MGQITLRWSQTSPHGFLSHITSIYARQLASVNFEACRNQERPKWTNLVKVDDSWTKSLLDGLKLLHMVSCVILHQSMLDNWLRSTLKVVETKKDQNGRTWLRWSSLGPNLSSWVLNIYTSFLVSYYINLCLTIGFGQL